MEKTNDDLPVLVAQAGPLNGQRWPLDTAILIGREATCDIVVSDRQVSRHHARLSVTSRGTVLEDLGSKNGTHHNGQRITATAYLQDGDVIQIALAQNFVYLSSDATVPLEAPETEVLSIQPPKQDITPAPRLRLEKRSRRVWIYFQSDKNKSSEQEILPPLSASQFKLLDILYENQGRVVLRQDIVARVWGEEAFAISEQALDALVRRLRERLSEIDPQHTYIVTIRGHGLRLDTPNIDD